MFDTLQQFFQRALSVQESGEQRQLTLELATAALLCEVIRADHHIDAVELDAWRRILSSRFSLEAQQVDELMRQAREETDQAVDHFQFVRLVNDHYDYDDKVALVELMWRLAYADKTLDTLEEHRIRTLADLLYVRHGDFIRTKLRVQEEHGAASA